MHLPICGSDGSIIWTLGSALCYTGVLSGEAFDSILLGGASDDDDEEEEEDGDGDDGEDDGVAELILDQQVPDCSAGVRVHPCRGLVQNNHPVR